MYTLDVFAEERYAGNQLAVFRNAADLSPETMQKIAREMNYSETTFILSDTPRDGGYDVRIFTPEEELPFAGHPALGTAYVILHEIMGTPDSQVKLNLKVGQIPVSVQPDGVLWMDQKPPAFGRLFEPAEITNVLSLELSDIDTRFPVQEVSTGLPFVIVALKSNGALHRAKRNMPAFEAFSKTHGRDMIYLFSAEPGSSENQLAARMLTIFQTMPEDPATGSACGCLGGYLVEHRYFGGESVDVRVEQGYDMGRPSLLRLKASRQPGHIAVKVGGKVIMVSKGQLL